MTLYLRPSIRCKCLWDKALEASSGRGQFLTEGGTTVSKSPSESAVVLSQFGAEGRA